ncbi:chemotaxis protein CheX [Peribacillus tepidiphilus]|uniref:chemotaxis protein CheX n=1 Tax=Peribacillus tepidiphilus TaxID=2652445 RepID=UPI0035B53684
MAISTQITNVLNGTIESVKSVIPLPVTIEKPKLIQQPLTQTSIGVLIGMTGDIRGRLVIEGSQDSIGRIGQSMFGMPLEGEILESFAGELGNMIAGNLATSVAQKGVEMDITPPTVLVGQTKLYGFDKALCLPVSFTEIGNIRIILMVEQ